LHLNKLIKYVNNERKIWWLSRKIEDFNSSVYYESPEYLYASYLSGDVL